jgi:hypothetical protein
MACKQLNAEEYRDLIRRNPQAVGHAQGQCECAVLCYKFQYGRDPSQGPNNKGIGDCSPCPPDYTRCLDCALPENAPDRRCSVQTDGSGLDRTTGTYQPWPNWFCSYPQCNGCCDRPFADWVEEDSFLTISVAGACSECG